VANESAIATAPKVDFGSGVAPQARPGAASPGAPEPPVGAQPAH